MGLHECSFYIHWTYIIRKLIKNIPTKPLVGHNCFKVFFPITDIATYRLHRGQFLKCITSWKGRDGVTITIFSSIHGMDKRPPIYRKTPTYRFEMNWIKFRLNSETFRGFLVKIKMKAYEKLTVVMCWQIVARKSIAPSSGNFWRRSAPR